MLGVWRGLGAVPTTGLSNASDSGLMLLAWGMRNAKASSHRLLAESPRAAKPPGSLGESPASLSALSGGNALAAPIKKTCPFEFSRHGRPKADTETRPAFLPSEVSQGESQKGKTGFLAREGMQLSKRSKRPSAFTRGSRARLDRKRLNAFVFKLRKANAFACFASHRIQRTKHPVVGSQFRIRQ